MTPAERLAAAEASTREIQAALILAVAAVERLRAVLEAPGYGDGPAVPEAPPEPPGAPEEPPPPSRGSKLLDPLMPQWETFGDYSEDQGPDSTSD